jgi:hypothetical protein
MSERTRERINVAVVWAMVMGLMLSKAGII